MKPIQAPPPTRLAPTLRSRESLIQLVSDLVRMPWQKVDARHYLDDYQASQWLPPTPLKQLQLAKLRRLVWHCYLDVPWYGARISAQFRPSHIERLEGLERLPVVRAAERRRNPSAFLSTAKEEIADERLTATHGDRVLVDFDALERRTAVRARVERWAGAPPGRIVAAWGRESVRSERVLDPAELAALRIAILRARGAVVTGPPSSLGALAEALAADAGRARKRSALRWLGLSSQLAVSGVIARGEDRRSGGPALAELLGARLSRWYAAAEVGVIAATCDRAPSPTALHVQADHVLLEILDDHGHPVPAGDDGQVHVTDLHNYAAPYLRHDLGDLGRLLPHPCPCGRALPLFELVGRA